MSTAKYVTANRDVSQEKIVMMSASYNRVKRIVTILFTLANVANACKDNCYAAPNGQQTADGSLSAPWDLQTALSKAAPGDTVWLRGGDYKGRFNCYASGTPVAPVIFRQYPGEHSRIQGPATEIGTITLQCHDDWFWGFEIYSTDANRVSSQAGSFPTDIRRGPAIEGAPDGSNCKLINMIIHDDFNSFFGKQAANFEVYGSIFYYSGWDAPDRGHGHGIYGQNSPATGTKQILENILFDSFAEGLQVYAEGGDYLYNFDIRGNVVFNSGALSQTSGYTTNLMIGGGVIPPKSVTLVDNFTYHSPDARRRGSARAVWLGSTEGCSNMIVKNNWFVAAAGAAVHRMPSCNATVEGNTFVGRLENLSPAAYPENTFYESNPEGTNVFVRPNQFEDGRANIIVYNWDEAASVEVDLSAVLKIGASYEIRDAQNFYGRVVVEGQYSGAPVHIPMIETTVASAIGRVPMPPKHTSPEFGVFVLLSPAR